MGPSTDNVPGRGSAGSMELGRFRGALNQSLRVFFLDALRVALLNPAQAYSFFRTVLWQRKAARVRQRWVSEGVQVPPITIFSVTRRCNLECKGCYSKALHGTSDPEMNGEKVRSIVEEATELGVSFFVLAGGEPFIRPEILDITSEFPQVLFLVFTNGLLIDESVMAGLKKQRNVVPLLSIDGNEDMTDERRGPGTYRRVRDIFGELRRRKIFFGASLTMTRMNFDTLTNEAFIREIADAGCRFFLFLEYTPAEEGTEDWIPTAHQRSGVMRLMEEFHSKFRALFIAVPAHEEDVGGCLAAGRGFVHINASGDVEPCPFAPWSDSNLQKVSLKEALGSTFLRTLREHPENLRETGGGCALWTRREWVQSLLEE